MRVEHELHHRRRGRNWGVGLLLGAVVGLWPFPEGQELTLGLFGGAAAIALTGFAATLLLGRLGGEGADEG